MAVAYDVGVGEVVVGAGEAVCVGWVCVGWVYLWVYVLVLVDDCWSSSSICCRIVGLVISDRLMVHGS